MVVLVAILLVIGQVIYLWKTDQLYTDLKYHFDWRSGIPALICGIIGLVFFLLPGNGEYWLLHSFWHIFIALAIFFEFMMYDIDLLCCCIKKPICNCPNCHSEGDA
jgi:predicted membrane channel-forming protein YqfA (hemolysin III family)